GGAHAVTTDAATVSPFGSLPTGTGSSGLPISLPPVSALPNSSGFGLPTTSPLPTSATTPTTTATGGGTKQSLGPIQKTTNCISLSPAGGGCNTSNMAVPIGLIGLGLVFLLAAWDYVRQRRRAQLIGQEVTA